MVVIKLVTFFWAIHSASEDQRGFRSARVADVANMLVWL